METWKLANHLGHDETMTRKVYGRLMPEAQFEAATFAAKALIEDMMPELEGSVL